MDEGGMVDVSREYRRELGRRLRGLASEVERVLIEADRSTAERIGDLDRVEFAKRLYGMRRVRCRYIDQCFLGEPAWDIMLDLFVAGSEKREISVSSAGIAAAVPATTALRWLEALERQGTIRRVRSGRDRRRVYVELTESGRAVVAATLDRMLLLFRG